jgi:hypothetical protein
MPDIVDSPSQYLPLLNDVVFDKYQLFQPTVRMLPGFRPAPQGR